MFIFFWFAKCSAFVLCTWSSNAAGKLNSVLIDTLNPKHFDGCLMKINELLYTIVELGEVAGVVVELEKQGFSGEEIIEAIDRTDTSDLKTLTDAIICRFT